MKFFGKFSKKSYSLAELAVVLLISATLLSSTVTAYKAYDKVQKVTNTKEKMAKIQNALITFFAKNNRLPLPNNPTVTTSDPNFGKESQSLMSTALSTASTGYEFLNQATGTSNTVVNTAQPVGSIVWGALPVFALGLKSEDAFDEYGNKFMYIVPSQFTLSAGPLLTSEWYSIGSFQKGSGSSVPYQNEYAKSTSQLCPVSANCSTNSGIYGVQIYNNSDGTTLTKTLFAYNFAVYNERNGTVISGTQNNTAYALISYGANGNCAFDKKGTSPSNTAPTTNEKYNCLSYYKTGTVGSNGSAIGPYISSTNYSLNLTVTGTDRGITLYNGATTNIFDDLVVWDTLENLMNKSTNIGNYGIFGKTNSVTAVSSGGTAVVDVTPTINDPNVSLTTTVTLNATLPTGVFTSNVDSYGFYYTEPLSSSVTCGGTFGTSAIGSGTTSTFTATMTLLSLSARCFRAYTILNNVTYYSDKIIQIYNNAGVLVFSYFNA